MRALVAFYARSESTRKAAERIGQALSEAAFDVELEEIVDTKSREGTFGWIGGRTDATLGKATEIEPALADVSACDLVVAGTPVWAWTVTPAVRTFLAAHASEIRQAAFFCTITGAGEKRVFEEMEEAADRTAVATVALADRHVRRDDECEFLGRVDEFVGEVIRALGRGEGPGSLTWVSAGPRAVGTTSLSARTGEEEVSETDEETGEEIGPSAPDESAPEAEPDSGANAINFETCGRFLDRFGLCQDAVLREVEIAFDSGAGAWSARVVLSVPDGEENEEDEEDKEKPGGRFVDVTFTVEDVSVLRMEAGEAQDLILSSGIRLGFLDDLVYLDLRPRSESSETLEDFLRSALMIAGGRCTWEVGVLPEDG